MQLLNPNIVNLGYPIYDANGLGRGTVLFFEQAPEKETDMRNYFRKCAVASSITIQSTLYGYCHRAESNVGIKAVAGSVYRPDIGMTIHYPDAIIPFAIPWAAGAVPETEAGNVNMYGRWNLLPYQLPGTVLSHATPTSKSVIDVVAQLEFNREVVVDAVWRNSRTKDTNAKMVISPKRLDSEVADTRIVEMPIGGTTIATESATTRQVRMRYDIAAPVATNKDSLNIGQAGDHGTAPVTKTVTHALFIFPRYEASKDQTDYVMWGSEVGATGSNTYIELEKVTLSTGEFPVITNLRTGLVQ